MRLLCVSDTTRSLAFSPSIKSVYHDTDLILSAGDIPLESYDYMERTKRSFNSCHCQYPYVAFRFNNYFVG